jgi:hypothetical protein
MTASTAAPTTVTRSSTQQHTTHKPAMAGLAILVGVLAVAIGIVLGQRLTAGPAAISPAAPGAAVSFPSDWQQYRAGERGDVPQVALPGDWSSYRTGEH